MTDLVFDLQLHLALKYPVIFATSLSRSSSLIHFFAKSFDTTKMSLCIRAIHRFHRVLLICSTNGLASWDSWFAQPSIHTNCWTWFLGNRSSTVPISSHSTCTNSTWRTCMLLLDFLTKDLLITSAVGTTTALTHLIYKIFCCLLQLWRLWMTFYLYLIRRICSWSATLSAARLLQLSSIHGILFSI